MEQARSLDPAVPAPAPRPPLRAVPPPDAERLASLGLVTASVAHELNGPLSYVLGNLGLVVAALSEAAAAGRPVPTEEVRRLLPAVKDALTGVEQMRSIAADLRQLSRRDDGPVEPVQVARAVERALAMAGQELKGRAQVVRRLEPVPPVAALEGRLVQVLLNLLVNAAHAIPPGGAAEHRVTISCRAPREGWIELAVCDTGCGIPRERLARIFEPFFTTKRAGAGTGLGLYLSRAIVASFGGSLEAESEAGRGTTMRLLLRAWQGGAEGP